MATPIIAGDFGDEEIFLTRWHKEDGSVVANGEAICELESDVAGVDLVASDAGILRHLKREGDVVRAGELVGRIVGEVRG